MDGEEKCAKDAPGDELTDRRRSSLCERVGQMRGSDCTAAKWGRERRAIMCEKGKDGAIQWTGGRNDPSDQPMPTSATPSAEVLLCVDVGT